MNKFILNISLQGKKEVAKMFNVKQTDWRPVQGPPHLFPTGAAWLL